MMIVAGISGVEKGVVLGVGDGASREK